MPMKGLSKFFEVGAALALALLAMGSVAADLASEPPGFAVTAKEFAPQERIEFGAIDQAKIDAEDRIRDAKVGRYRYAIPFQVKGVDLTQDADTSGRWRSAVDGRALWQLKVTASGAKTTDLIFRPFRLPHGAELWVYSEDRSSVLGPYTDADNNAFETLALPVIGGEVAIVELAIPEQARPFLKLKLETVHSGYRGFSFEQGKWLPKAGSCNVDSVCSQGDAIRPQIQSTGRYQVAGGLCTGTLINNTNGDLSPLFLSARHCYSTQADASTVVVYWNYASSTCRAVGSSANGQVLPLSLATHQQSGATLLSSSALADFTLARLNQPVPTGANPFFAGWDRRDLAPTRAYCVHHPSGHEKRISFDNDPLRITTATQTFGSGGDSFSLAPGNGLQIVGSDFQPGADGWDIGTTEQGSSGSALFSPEGRVIGTLSGGGAACGNTDSDFYGRMAIAFATGTTSQTRLREHLDPANSGAQTLDGRGSCNAPQLALSISSGTVITGNDTIYQLSMNGGSPPYSVRWDIDGDGVFDRTQNVNGATTNLTARYPRSLSANVRVEVTDSAACTSAATRAIDVAGHDVRPTALATPVQVCGDGDGAVEPGERWRVPVTLNNFGNANVQGGFAAFTKSGVDSSSVSGASDSSSSTGYSYRDNRVSGCGYNFVDLQGFSSLQNLELTQSDPRFPALDDGRTGNISLGNSAFNLLGSQIAQIVVSTNGYITANTSAVGNDTQAVCGSTPSADAGSRRLNVLHSDLVLGSSGNIRAGSFASCPRAPDVGASTQPCLVVQWSRVGVFTGATPVGDFDLQAVIYPQTGQITYQYRNTFPAQSPRNVVGILNSGAASFNYQCQDSATVTQPFKVNGSRSVCFYPSGQSPAPLGGNLDAFKLVTPAISLGNVPAGQGVSGNVEFYLNQNASCGSQYKLTYMGTADERAFSGNPIDTTISIPASCNVITNCPAPNSNTSFRQGAFFNPNRGGNGLVHYGIGTGASATYFGAFFTGESNRRPTWYFLQGPLADGQHNGTIFRRTRNVNASGFVLNSPDENLGTGQVTFIDSGRAIFTHQFQGQLRGGELLTHLLRDFPTATPNRTGAWFAPAESGWGQTWDSFVQTGANNEFNVSYLYDSAGAPRWVLAQGLASAPSLSALSFEVHCPNCAWMDIAPTSTAAGTVTRQFTGSGTANVSTSFAVPGAAGSRWDKNNLPFIILTEVQP